MQRFETPVSLRQPARSRLASQPTKGLGNRARIPLTAEGPLQILEHRARGTVLGPELYRTACERQRLSRAPQQNIGTRDLEVSHAKPRICLDGPRVRLDGAFEIVCQPVGVAQVEVRQCLTRIESERLLIRLAGAWHVPEGRARESLTAALVASDPFLPNFIISAS